MGDQVKWTEGSVADLLRSRYSGTGNGGAGEYAFLTQVRDAAGFQSKRTFDAVAISLWPSRGLTVHVHEIKVSRSDWLRELKKPDKAEDAFRIADHFSIVAPSGVVKTDELPVGWGLLQIVGSPGAWKIRQTVAPALIPHAERDKVTRSFLVALLRACPGAIPGGGRTDDEIRRIESAARTAAQADAERRIAEEVVRRQGTAGRIAAEWADLAAVFRQQPGLRYSVRTPADVIRLVPMLAAVEALDSTRRGLASLARSLDAHAAECRSVVDALAEAGDGG